VLVRGLNALAATVSTPQAAPVIAPTRLRGGSANTARGAASFAAAAPGNNRKIIPKSPQDDRSKLRGGLRLRLACNPMMRPFRVRDLTERAAERSQVRKRCGAQAAGSDGSGLSAAAMTLLSSRGDRQRASG